MLWPSSPSSTICHCRMCQKAVGGPFAALSKVALKSFTWTRGLPASFRSSSSAERHFCAACGTPLTFQRLGGDAIEVTTGSLDAPALVPPTTNFGTEARLPWIEELRLGRLRHADSGRQRWASGRDQPAAPRLPNAGRLDAAARGMSLGARVRCTNTNAGSEGERRLSSSVTHAKASRAGGMTTIRMFPRRRAL